jgi:hypothetical protein
MNLSLFLVLILLIIIDLLNKPFVLITAFIQFICFSLIHINSHYYSVVIDFFYKFSFKKMFFFCVFICLFEFLYFFIELHFNVMIFTMIGSVPYFYYHNLNEKILDDERNVYMLQIVFKVSIKLVIITVNCYECDLFSNVLFATWLLVLIYKNCYIRFLRPVKISSKPQANNSELSITEKELKKLHEFYSKKFNLEKSSLNSASQKR